MSGIASLINTGWKPLRTMVVAMWDGSELGSIGSTAWAELNDTSVTDKGIAYINMNAITGSDVQVSATASYQSFLKDAMQSLIDPKIRKPLDKVFSGNISLLGGGSDYEVFTHHFGLASMDIQFKGDFGVYNSVYDSLDWFR